MYADISFPISTYRVFTYRIPENLESDVQVGVRILAPFGVQKKAQGVVVNLHKKSEFKGKILSISTVLDLTPIFDQTLWDLINWVSHYYLTPIGQVIRTAVPSGLTLSYRQPERLMVQVQTVSEGEMSVLSETSPGQTRVLEYLKKQGNPIPVADMQTFTNNVWAICRILEKKGYVTLSKKQRIPDVSGLSFFPIAKQINFTTAQTEIVDGLGKVLEENRFAPYLLHGVTGSGKTEIYIHLAQQAEEAGKRSIMLLPEISLTPQFAGRFRAVFNERVAIWHSQMTKAERAWTWTQICKDAYSVVVGARSAIFTPVRNVGLIVVDEEQESGFKQESPAPRYHARDVALMRGKLSKALTILAGATPSLESYYNQAVGKLNYLPLKSRYGGAKYPEVHLVNMKEERKETGDYTCMLSRLLAEKIGERLEKREQVILLQNRRGFSPTLFCNTCGYTEMCFQCKISLTFHKVENGLKCHYCNFRKPVPVECKGCGGSNMVLWGVGTQKVEESLFELFPRLRLIRMDQDTTRRRGAYTRILQEFGLFEYDILLGTQMIAKGLDFENVTLVGIIDADTGLYLPDFRVGERTFQLVYQVSGRSGRGKKSGEVVIQTSNPDNPAIQSAAALDIKKYYNICLNERKALLYPPFSWMAKVEFSGKKQVEVEKQAEDFLKNLQEVPRDIKILGPAPCPIERIRGNYRYQIIFKSPKEKDNMGKQLHKFLEKNLKDSSVLKRRKGVFHHVDVDPASLL